MHIWRVSVQKFQDTNQIADLSSGSDITRMLSAPRACQSNVRAPASRPTALIRFAVTNYTQHEALHIPKGHAACARVPRPSLTLSA